MLVDGESLRELWGKGRGDGRGGGVRFWCVGGGLGGRGEREGRGVVS